ncbi:glycosidase [Planctomycetota bacterium]
MKPLFQRDESNPILTPRDMPFTAEAVLNPGAVEHNGDVVLLLRVEDTSGYSDIYVARSRNGITDWKIDKKPLLKHGEPKYRYEKWGCEDARISYLADEELYYITYTAYSSYGAAVALARTRDFEKVERLQLIMPPSNKDACLFPRKFNGRWAMLHRPDAGGVENIWIASSPDLIHWGQPRCVLAEGAGAAWDTLKVGAGPPPILTKHGWLLLYHGVKGYAGQLVYRVGAALLDKDKPYKLLARSPKAIFKATELYETTGLIANVVFPTGLLLRDDELWMYYGAGDTCVCLATVKLQDVLDNLEEQTGNFRENDD